MALYEATYAPSWAIFMTLLSVALATTFVFWRFVRRPAKTPTKLPELRDLTVRIDNISTTTDKSELEQNLKSAIEGSPGLDAKISRFVVRSLISTSPSRATATVIVSSFLSPSQLCERLGQAVSSSFQYGLTNTFDGITPVYASDGDVDVDIIAVTGLAGHALGSWKAKGGNDVWLRDFLPGDIPNIRVLLYGYDTALQNSKTKQCILDVGHTFLEQVAAFRARDKTSRRPIIFIGHSLGGLVVKQALVKANEQRDRDDGFLDISKACYGMLFFGVPNSGLRHQELEQLVEGNPNEELVRELVVDDDGEPRPYLRALKGQFSQHGKDLYHVISFYERMHTRTVKIDDDGKASRTGKERLQVSAESAWDTGLEGQPRAIPLDADHSEIVKYASSTSGPYQTVCRNLQKLVDQAPAEISTRFDYYLEQPLTQMEQDCLRYLAFTDMDSRRATIDRATEGTCSWLFEHEYFRSWRKEDRGLLWIQGNPGSGKSTLMEYTVREFLVKPGNGIVISFFCHGRGHELQKSPSGLLRSVLHQLLARFPRAFAQMTNEFAHKVKTLGAAGESWNWHQQQFQDFLTSALPRILQYSPVTFFFDALDEFGDDSARGLVDLFSRLLKQLPDTRYMFNICFSCRYYPILHFDTGSEIQVEKQNNQDIASYVRSRLNPGLPNAIGESVISNARGIFMWARLVMDRVTQLRSEGVSSARIQIEIQKVPHKLEDLYLDMLRKHVLHDDDKRRQSLALFQWMCFAEQPLTIDELPWAIAMTLDPTLPTLEAYERSVDFIATEDVIPRVKALSCGLVEEVPDTNDTARTYVQFIHQSVKDYFIEGGLRTIEMPEQDRAYLSPGLQRSVYQDAHFSLLLACFCAVRVCQVSWAYHMFTKNYVEYHWGAHLKAREPGIMHLDRMVQALGQPMKIYMCRFFEGMPGDPPGASGLTWVHIFSRFDLKSLCDLLGSDNQYMAQVNATDDLGRTPLWYAARFGCTSAIQALLETSSFEIDSANTLGVTPLAIAAQQDNQAAVRMLLDAGADTDARDIWGRTPLIESAEYGNQAIVRILLDAGVNTDTMDIWGRTPLICAAENGNQAIVRILLDAGADTDARDSKGRTPLIEAAKNGNRAIMRMLLDVGADTDARGSEERTPLMEAAKNGNQAGVRMLLDAGADTDARDSKGRTPLMEAAEYSNQAIVRMLLETGEIDIHAMSNDGRTLLGIMATHSGISASSMGYLLAMEQVVVDSRDSWGLTPLHGCAMALHGAKAEHLLNKERADVESRGVFGHTPISVARKSYSLTGMYSYRDPLKLLLNAKMRRRFSRRTFLTRNSGRIVVRVTPKPRLARYSLPLGLKGEKTSVFLRRHSGNLQVKRTSEIDDNRDDDIKYDNNMHYDRWLDDGTDDDGTEFDSCWYGVPRSELYHPLDDSGRYIYRNRRYWLTRRD